MNLWRFIQFYPDTSVNDLVRITRYSQSTVSHWFKGQRSRRVVSPQAEQILMLEHSNRGLKKENLMLRARLRELSAYIG